MIILGRDLDGSVFTIATSGNDAPVLTLTRSEAWRLQVLLQRALEHEQNKIDALREEVVALKRSNASLRGALTAAKRRKA